MQIFGRLILVSISILSYTPLSASACGEDTETKWQNPDPKSAAMSIGQAIDVLEKQNAVLVERSSLQSKCSSDVDFVVKDLNDNQFLGLVPVPNGGQDGRFLVVRVAQLLSPSKAAAKMQQYNLEQAWKSFRDDNEALESEWGVFFYAPSALSLAVQFPHGTKQLMYMTAPSRNSSSDLLSESVLINTTSYIPARTDYSEGTIYKKGDLKKLVFGNKDLFEAFKKRAAKNAVDIGYDKYADLNWVTIAARLQSESTDQLLKSTFDRYVEKQKSAQAHKPLSANYASKHEIVIKTIFAGTSSEEIYFGTIMDILRIERHLRQQGVTVTRTLNWKGKIEAEYEKMPEPLNL